MPGYLRGYCDRSAVSSTDPNAPLRFVASTEGVKRDGQDLSLSQWDLTNFRNTNLFLWVHDYSGQRLPIGKVDIDADTKSRSLIANVTFDPEDAFAREVRSKYERGFLNAVSVGWDVIIPEGKRLSEVTKDDIKLDLLDLSGVPIPGDPSALMLRQKRALAALGHELLDLADDPADPQNDDPKPNQNPDPANDPPSARATWPETAASMVRLFRPFVQGPDADRQTEYRRLAREYARHGKTAPEFLAATEVDALSVDDIRGHFLEGEPELHADTFAAMATRAGAVLSTRNQEDLQTASDLILGVLARAKKEAEQTDEERAAEAELRKLRDIFKGDQTA